jgi:Protein of unknown function (DUF3040)
MEHDATELTAEERRIFDEIERSVDGPGRRRWRRRRRPSVSRSARRWLWWVEVLLGAALLVGALWSEAAVVGAAGFVALVVGLSQAVQPGVARRSIARLRGWLGRDGRSDDAGRSGAS